MSVKNTLIKLAYENPELRAELLPIINKTSSANPENISDLYEREQERKRDRDLMFEMSLEEEIKEMERMEAEGLARPHIPPRSQAETLKLIKEAKVAAHSISSQYALPLLRALSKLPGNAQLPADLYQNLYKKMIAEWYSKIVNPLAHISEAVRHPKNRMLVEDDHWEASKMADSFLDQFNDIGLGPKRHTVAETSAWLHDWLGVCNKLALAEVQP